MQNEARRPIRVLTFAASLRRDSLNVRLLSVARSIVARVGAEVDAATMGEFDCPSYDGDVETKDGIPSGASRFRERLLACDAFVISSPEYNGSMPGVLKNVIDWASRF